MTIEQYFRNLASAAFVPLIFWAVLAVSMHQDRSRYRNTIYLMLAMVSSLPFAAALLGPAEQTAAGVISAGILILLLAVPYMLIANGVTMIRKEGRRLADLLSLLMGILVGTGELSFFLFILLPYLSSGASGTAGNISKVQMSLLFIGLSVIFFSLVFVSFMFYTRFMGILPIRKDFDCCIILGCGLLAGGKVSKLLAGRLDKAIELYRKDPTPPVMIPSGGQGPDEAVSEASAMRDYLIANGIPEDMIRIEDKSANTEENIRNSMKILNACPGDQYTAVFCVSDLYAVTLIAALVDAGKRVPEDISVIGFDDIPHGRISIPALTTVHQPLDRTGEQAVDILFDCIQKKTVPFESSIVCFYCL